MKLFVGLATLLFLAVLEEVSCHGRLTEPASRATMWRQGFNNPPDYNDMEGFCGGLEHQFGAMGGKCGICGDPYDASPREHEAPGGKYANGIIVKKYTAGQMIDVQVEVTANHLGYFEFKLCANDNTAQDPTQDCFEKTVLEIGDEKETKYYIPSTAGMVNLKVALPQGVTCSQCILQWTYVGGNNWGTCDDGESRPGCGPQEHFRACADIHIV